MNNPYVYQAIAIKHALKIYAKTGMKVNTAYTPTNMLKAAQSITGIKYKQGQYLQAAEDIENVLNNLKSQNETL